MLLLLPLLLPGALPRPLLMVFPAPIPPWCCFFSIFCSSLCLFISLPPLLLLLLLMSSIFFIDFFLTISLFFILFLFEVSSSLGTSSDEAEIGETFEDGFKRRLTVYLSVLRMLPMFRQFIFCIGLFEPIFVHCDNDNFLSLY